MSGKKKIIISGGGTGGHIFPAIAIAQALQKLDSTTEVLFVGAEGKMEMSKVPAAGYSIIGLPIVGLQRQLTLKNLAVPFKILASLWKAHGVLRNYRPDLAIGVGGYASGPLLRMAAWMGIRTVIQEQNSYPGITNKLLAKKASLICVAYPGLERYFPSDKLVMTGNPVRDMVTHTEAKRSAGQHFFDLDPQRRTVLIIGGSLGARTINQSVESALQAWTASGLQILWQTGKAYYERAQASAKPYPGVRVFDFISEMDLAYGASDIIVSRAGAMSISELCIVGKPCILIPSPNVAEDHQTKNAMALVKKNAALLVTDNAAPEQLQSALLGLSNDEAQMQQLGHNCRQMAFENAATHIAEAIYALLKEK